VKHKRLKILQLLYHSLMTKLSTPPFLKNSLNTYITLLTYLLPCPMYQSQVHDVEKLLNIWHRLQQSAVQSEMDGERVYTAKGGHFEL